jgi:hypothetical protein
MSRPRTESAVSASALPVRTSEQLKAAFRTSEQPAQPVGKTEQPDALAAELLNAAFDAAGLENKEIAHLCGVSVSLVEKWRSPETRGCPSFLQLLLLPPSFHWHLHKAINRHFGFGRLALIELLDAAGLVAATNK